MNRHARGFRTGAFALPLAIAALALLPGSAFASTVMSNGSSTITYTGSGTEANNLTITAGGAPNTYTIHDPNAAITATPGNCVGGGAMGVDATCTASALTTITSDLGNGNDSVNTSSLPITVVDTYLGGNGEDTVSYASTSTAVVADPDGNPDDGRDTNADGVADETDNIGSDVEDITGGSGDDHLTGSNTDGNVLTGNAGNDDLRGRLGDDTLIGNAGDDSYDGGGDNDTASFPAGGVTASLVSGTATGEAATQDTLTSIENLTGGTGADTLTGDSGPNTLTGGDAGDTIDGGGGIDTVMGQAGNDTLSGGAGDDTGGAAGVFGGDGDDTLHGNAGTDTLDGGENAETNGDTASYDTAAAGVIASLLSNSASNDGDGASDNFAAGSIENLTGSGNGDTLTGDAAKNALTGNGGIDNLTAGAEADTLNGGAGGDTLDGGTEADTLNGDAADDTLIGGAGGDTLHGGDGDDTLRGNAGVDTLDGGESAETAGDTADYSTAAAAVTGSLNANAASDDGDGSNDTYTAGTIENVTGSDLVASADSLTGDANANTLNGLAGPDTLDGVGGADTVDGGADSDTVRGGAGDDVAVRGGAGSDAVVNGGPGNDASVEGGPGDDIVEGDDGNDNLKGNGGTDDLDGGNGIDTASYEQAAAGVTASLQAGTASNDGDGGNDTTLVDIENLTGSEHVDDLTGSTGVTNTLTGRGANDTLRIREGGADADSAICDQGSGGAGTADAAIVDANDTANTDCENVDAPGAPNTTVTSGPAQSSTTGDNTPTFGFSSTEPGSTYKCSLVPQGNADSFGDCSTTGTLNPSTGSHSPADPLDDGTYVFKVRASDSGADDGTPNTDATPDTRTFTVDTTDPQTTITGGPTGTTTINTPTFTFSSNEAGTFECSLDGGGFSDCSSPETLGPLADGEHTFQVRATDGVGNVDATPASQTFTVNTAALQQPATQTPVVTPPAPKKSCKKIKNRAKRKKCFKKQKQAG